MPEKKQSNINVQLVQSNLNQGSFAQVKNKMNEGLTSYARRQSCECILLQRSELIISTRAKRQQ